MTDAELVQEYRDTKSNEAYKTLWLRYYKLAYHLMRKAVAGINLDDLVVDAFIQALDTFDASKECSFGTHLSWQIRGVASASARKYKAAKRAHEECDIETVGEDWEALQIPAELDLRHLQEHVWYLLAAAPLSSKQRTCMELLYRCDWTRGMVAAAMHVSKQMVHMWHNQSINILSTKYAHSVKVC